MGRCIYQHIGYALCISATVLLYGSDGSDLSTPCKVVGLLKDFGQHQAEKNHAALHQQKQELKENLHQEVVYFTDRLDQLIELAVFMVTSGPLNIFLGSMQQVQSDDDDCAWCLSERILFDKYKENQKEYQKLIDEEARPTVCEQCYSKKRYSPIAFDSKVKCGDGEQGFCISCEYIDSCKQIDANRWFTVTQVALKQLKSSSYFNICTKSHVFDISIEAEDKDQLFQDNATTVIQEYVEYVVNRISLFSKEKIDLNNCLQKEHAQKFRNLLKAYADHLAEVSDPLSPKAELELLRNLKNKPGQVKGFLNRKPFIEKLYEALCISKKQVERMVYTIQE